VRASTPDLSEFGSLSDALAATEADAAPIAPETIVLEARGEPDRLARPPVRIFLGTEDAQWRAERIFVWSIEQVRDPARRYEIMLMKDLPGFDTRRWTTGFTNYRFAIPHLAGREGRAIYNDVDQIYLADPAELFDLPLEAGLRAIAPDDLSVMLLDCRRLAAVWALESAQLESKSKLIAWARDSYEPLAREWNARDDELEPGTEKLLHYTTLHTQPWRPFPARFAYQPNPRGHLWHALERSADAAGFELHTRERPSQAYLAWRKTADSPASLPTEEPGSEPYFPPEPSAPTAMPCPTRLAGAALAELPVSDIAWVLDDLFAAARKEVRIELPWDGERETADRWETRLEIAARRAPKRRWSLTLRGRGVTEVREGGAWLRAEPPRVWVLADDRPGNTTQSRGLADALGWGFEEKTLVMGPRAKLHNRWLGASRAGLDLAQSSPLEAPWPDLIIAAGRRTAPVARWIRAQSGGRTRLVLLGRKGGDDADLFDRVVTPSYTRLPEHPRRIQTAAPLHRITPASLDAARSRFADTLGAIPGPRIALLVGGTSGQYRIGPRRARALGRAASEFARAAGGALLVTTSRRVSPAATNALRKATPDAALFHAWRPDDAANPYVGLLAYADAVIVTADSESMLAEACTTGVPVYVAELDERASFRLLARLRDAVWRRSQAQPDGPRGTPRPQRGLERFAGRLIERGWVRPSRDLGRFHAALEQRGAIRRLTDGYDPDFVPSPITDRSHVVAELRRLMGLPA
jgi:mitochondrial fission protein ELM1